MHGPSQCPSYLPNDSTGPPYAPPPNALLFQCLPMFPPPNIALPSQIDLLMESIDLFFPTVTSFEPLYREQAVHGNWDRDELATTGQRSTIHTKGSKCHTIQVLVNA